MSKAGGNMTVIIFIVCFLRFPSMALFYRKMRKLWGTDARECWKFFIPLNVEFFPFWLGSIIVLWWWLKVKEMMANLFSIGWLHNKMLFLSVGPQRVYNQARWHNGSSILNIDTGCWRALRLMDSQENVWMLWRSIGLQPWMDSDWQTFGNLNGSEADNSWVEILQQETQKKGL